MENIQDIKLVLGWRIASHGNAHPPTELTLHNSGPALWDVVEQREGETELVVREENIPGLYNGLVRLSAIAAGIFAESVEDGGYGAQGSAMTALKDNDMPGAVTYEVAKQRLEP